VLLLTLLGIEGAAIAWTLRVGIDCAGKLLLAAWLYPAARQAARRLAVPLVAGGGGLALLLVMPGTSTLAAAGTLALATFLAAAFRTLDPAERSQIGTLVRHPTMLLRANGARP
jgi:hypothetical protein